jgi:hypothetical protein
MSNGGVPAAPPRRERLVSGTAASAVLPLFRLDDGLGLADECPNASRLAPLFRASQLLAILAENYAAARAAQ